MKALASYYMAINTGGCKEHRRTYKMMSSREERRGEERHSDTGDQPG